VVRGALFSVGLQMLCWPTFPRRNLLNSTRCSYPIRHSRRRHSPGCGMPRQHRSPTMCGSLPVSLHRTLTASPHLSRWVGRKSAATSVTDALLPTQKPTILLAVCRKERWSLGPGRIDDRHQKSTVRMHRRRNALPLFRPTLICAQRHLWVKVRPCAGPARSAPAGPRDRCPTRGCRADP